MSGREPNSTAAAVVDAAVRVLADVGVVEATADLVAQYAGVPLASIWRDFPTSAQLFGTAIRREISSSFHAAFDSTVTEHSFDAVVVTAFAATVTRLDAHPLTAGTLGTERDTALALSTAYSAPILDSMIALVADRLSASARATGHKLADPHALADVFVRLVHALVLASDASRPTARPDVERYARRHLAPLACGSAVPVRHSLASASAPDLHGTRGARARRGGHKRLPLALPLLFALLLGSAGLAAALVQTSASVNPTIRESGGSSAPPATAPDAAPRSSAASNTGTVPSAAEQVPPLPSAVESSTWAATTTLAAPGLPSPSTTGSLGGLTSPPGTPAPNPTPSTGFSPPSPPSQPGTPSGVTQHSPPPHQGASGAPGSNAHAGNDAHGRH